MPRVKILVPVAPAVTQESTDVVAAPAQVAQPTVPAQPSPATAPSSASPTRPNRRPTKQQLVIGGVLAGFVIMILLLVSVMNDKNRLESKVAKLSTHSSAAASEEVNKLTASIEQSYQLPTGETPTLATVSDVTKVRNQAFFKNAQNGDKVLLYSKAGQAILYRPSTKKIISVAPVNLNGNDALPTTNSSTSK